MNRHLTEQELIRYRFKLASDNQMRKYAVHLDGCAGCREHLERLARKFAALDLLRNDVRISEELISQVVEQVAQSATPVTVSLRWYWWMGAAAAVILMEVGFLSVPGLRERTGHVPFPVEQRERGPVGDAFRDRGGDAGGQKGIVARGRDSGGEGAIEEGRVRPAAGDRTYAFRESGKEMIPRESGQRTGGEAVGPTLSEPELGLPSQRTKVAAAAKPMGDMPLAENLPKLRELESLPERGRLPGEFAGMMGGPIVAGQGSEQPPFAPASAIELVVLPRREQVQLTIYNSADLTLVRERRNLTLKRGWNWLQFMWANTLIDPTSLHLEPLEHKDQVRVEQLVFPPRLRELGRWLIRSEVTGQVPFELTCFTSGLTWRAFYIGTLSQDEKTMYLEGHVRVNNNSGEDYENAQTRLIVGKVHLLDEIAHLARRQYSYGSPLPTGTLGGEMGGYGASGGKRTSYWVTNGQAAETLMESLDVKEIRKEGLSEYFLYTIEGTETIPNQWGKRLLSFEVNDIPVTSLCKYDEERWGTETIRFLSFVNDEKHKLGKTPIPDGAVRIYGRVDEQGHLSYVGGMDVKYIPVGEKVELDLGPARLVKVEPLLMDTRTGNYVFDNKGDVAGWDEIETWQLKLTNTRDIPVELEITRGFGTRSWELTLVSPADGADIDYKKHDVTHARFTTTMHPKSQRTFEYTVTKYQGARSQSYVEREKERRP
jgi:hypothetical protein